MTVTLEKLGGDTRNSFIEKLKESFDAFVEENPGTPEGPVISCGEIEASLNRPGTVKTWELYTPYVETRNIHFYVNKCGYKIVEFFNPKHPLVMPESEGGDGSSSGELFFRFEKKMDENEVTS